jgi:phthiocerol/phenolphthiocerol synthesis type-I polyketide synthase E
MSQSTAHASASSPAEESAIAVVGMAGRFPGAADVESYWSNLCEGVESIAHFSEEELADAGLEAAIYEQPNYVSAKGALEGVDLFDAGFFGFSAREAEMMDPQHRLFLESCWHGLEHAACDPYRYEGRIGVYAGASTSSYLLHAIARDPQLIRSFYLDEMPLMIGVNDDFLATRVSYKLNLRGPSMTVQTACSTSLVAIHLASQSLLYGECDLALAGGAAVQVPHKAGYLYREGGAKSSDGVCRAFDRDAGGTVGGSGVGVVVLKRLRDALAEGDFVHAVVRGTAVNNDGYEKVGYTAPSISGQAQVIADALAVAGVKPDSIGYVETHGTGTALGDPIEIAALTQAFRQQTGRRGFCAIGSVKPNIGHLDAAAGVAGFIKAVLAVGRGEIPPSLNYSQPSPKIDFEGSPFYVNTTSKSWPSNGAGEPRRAGVSSFGIGGTNAHVVLEAPPARGVAVRASRPEQLLLVSARSGGALQDAARSLAGWLEHARDVPLADIAYTLQTGRHTFEHRLAITCENHTNATNALRHRAQRSHGPVAGRRSVAFVFPGGGSQYVDMGRELYSYERVFREHIDHCAELALPHLGFDLRHALYPGAAEAEWAARAITRTGTALGVLFAVEYALAKLWMSWGVRPWAMIGHSLGEYVAACLAGVFSLEDALALVSLRGRLFEEELPAGAMIAISLPEQQLLELLGEEFSLAAVNGPRQCVASGPTSAVEALSDRLSAHGAEFRVLKIDAAGHSSMVDGIVERFVELADHVARQEPQIPFVSNVTGTWITPEQATDPGYWGRHLRETVRFHDGLSELLATEDSVLLQVGPGRLLDALALGDRIATCSSVRHPRDDQTEHAVLLAALGRLWLEGVEVDWAGFSRDERRERVPLPGYPFERRSYWLLHEQRVSTEQDPSLETTQPGTPSLYERPSGTIDYIAPRDELEELVAAIWGELLGFEQISVEDNFYALGGHSLLATRLVARLREEVQIELPLESFFEALTVASQAEILRQAMVEALETAPDELTARHL